MKIAISTLVLSVFLSTHLSAAEKPTSWGDHRFIEYPTTETIFYGSGIDVNKDWNICVGATDGGVEVHLRQQILPIQNCPGEYVVVRTHTDRDGKLIKRSTRRLSDYGSVPI